MQNIVFKFYSQSFKQCLLKTFGLLVLSASLPVCAEQFTVNADQDISQDLDLNAVASVFGQSKDLSDFEQRLNDPKQKISNLDLNHDGEVDYLRVVENVEGQTHVISIQSVLDKNVYQDVATVDVEQVDKKNTTVQVVGSTTIYGENYIVQPTYSVAPVIFTLFWSGVYYAYFSPFYWHYYPPFFRPWAPLPIPLYRRNVNVFVNVNNHYRRVDRRFSHNAPVLERKNARNDWNRDATRGGINNGALSNGRDDRKLNRSSQDNRNLNRVPQNRLDNGRPDTFQPGEMKRDAIRLNDQGERRGSNDGAVIERAKDRSPTQVRGQTQNRPDLPARSQQRATGGKIDNRAGNNDGTPLKSVERTPKRETKREVQGERLQSRPSREAPSIRRYHK